ATATNTTFSIHITEPDNNSDAARTMVAINSYVEYFLDAMNTWMTQTGQTKIEMPNGEVVTLDSIKKMQGDISNKADLTATVIQTFLGPIESINSIWAKKSTNNRVGLVAEDNRRFISTRAENGSAYNSIGIPDKNGTMMLIGDYGIGGNSPLITENNELINKMKSGFFRQGGGVTTGSFFNEWGNGISLAYSESAGYHIFGTLSANKTKLLFCKIQNGNVDHGEIITTINTTTDPQGFIKKASPIININPDGSFTTNDESEGATVTQVAKGEYLIEGVLGFNSDAGWGGVDGGIEIPLDVNKQPLIWVDSKVNKDGSILVKTYHRTHPNAPKFARNDIDGYKDGDPIDIPNGRFISVRVQMPEQSIYNVRMREMEEAQKVEEERRQKEEEENQDTNKTPEIDN
uniref:phage tail fiber protein n=1 Tax=Proteus terrae TaxID=1574161 RepID=UPI000D6989B7